MPNASSSHASHNVSMPAPMPVWIPELARRSFRFSPPITGAGANEWTLDCVTWDDAIVRNAATREEIAIPRRFFGDVTRLDEPVRVVALLKKLEYADGAIRPMHRAVIAMPVPAEAPRIRAAHPAEVVEIRETRVEPPRWRRYLRSAIALACLACFIAVYVFREARSGRVRRFGPRPVRLVPHSPASIPLALPERR